MRGKQGGVLVFAGNGDVDHLDAASANNVVSWDLLRVYTRQLVSRPTTSDPVLAAQIVPDLTVEVPTTANGGISADGLTYTFRIRPGASWNCPSGPRQITAQDVVLGIKRLFNPVCPTATPQYFTATIVGLAEFARGFAEVRHETKAIARYIDDHDVEGITARGQDTVVFRLVEPAIDFLDILTTAGASPAPREYLDYLPDGPEFRQQVVSSGPNGSARTGPGSTCGWTATRPGARKPTRSATLTWTKSWCCRA